MLSYLSPLTIAVWIATIAVQFLACVLLRKGRAPNFPAFRAYLYVYAFGCAAIFLVAALLPGMAYAVAYYFLTLSVDIVVFFVAHEIYRKVFGPRMALPKFVPERTAAMMAISFTASAFLSVTLRATNGGSWTRYLVTIEQVLTAAAFATFWILFTYSRSLRITWPKRVWEIWIGFALFLTVSVIAVFVRARASATFAIAADRTAQIADLLAVVWWTWRLRSKEEIVVALTTEEVREMRERHEDTMKGLQKAGIL
jgi:hypothetical protein